MLKRKIEEVLLRWKKTPERKPLVLKGCRQCGKTFSAMKFAREHYESTVYINFFQNPEYPETLGLGTLKKAIFSDNSVRSP